jgi:hypothetical protein
MGLWNHAVKVAIGVLVVGGLSVLGATVGITQLASVAWLKSEHDFWNATVEIIRWKFVLWAAVSIAVAAVLLLRVAVAAWASPYRAFVGEYTHGLIWEWAFNTRGEPVELRMFCAKCSRELHDSDFKYPMPGSTATECEVTCPAGHITKTESGGSALREKVKAEIELKIRTRKWKRYKRTLPK